MFVNQKKARKKQAKAAGNALAEVAIVDSGEIHWKAKARWADLDLALGRLDDALAKLRDVAANDPDWKRRTWAQSWIMTTGLYKANAKDLRACGSQALSTVLVQLDKPAAAQKVAQLHPKTAAGYSLAEMQTIAAKNGVAMRGFKATSAVALENLPTPFIVHYDFTGLKKGAEEKGSGGENWLSGSSLRGFDASIGGRQTAIGKQRLASKSKSQKSKTKVQNPYRISPESPNHFLVVQKVDGAKRAVQIYDPLEKRFYQLSFSQLEREWSGKGLMLAQGVKQARSASAAGVANTSIQNPQANLRIALLSLAEMRGTRGGCCGSFRANPSQGPTDTVKTVKGPCPAKGEPGIKVDQASLNVLIQDIPLWYTPAVGPSVELMVSYNSQDALTQASPVGNKWTLNYRSYAIEDTQAGGGVVIVFMPDSSKKSFYPNGSGGYNADAGNFSHLTKPTDTRYELELQGGETLIYDRPAGTSSLQSLLIEDRDARGNALQLHYEDEGIYTNLTGITDAQGKVTTLDYDSSGHVVRVTDPFERQASFRYDSNGNMVECVDMEGHAFQYTYDGSASVTQLNTAQGPWTIGGGSYYPTYALSVTDPLGKTQQYSYTAWGAATYRFASPNGSSEGYGCQAVVGGEPRITNTSSATGETTTIAYDYATGQPSSITDARGKVRTSSYNSQGMPTGTTDPLGHSTSISYAANGLDVTSVTNAENVTVFTAQYNAYHQPTQVMDAQGHTTTMTYTAWGAPATATDAAGQTTIYNYDAASKELASVSRAGSTLASFTHDEVGRVATATDALGFTVGYRYNNLDKVTKVTYPDGTSSSVEYVCCGMPGVVTDRSGRKSYYDYDPLKRLARMQDAQGNSAQLDYDASGNMSRLIDAQGNVTRWQYDADGRLSQKIYHDGTSESYAYSQGLLAQTTNPRGQVTGYAYDDDSRLTIINYPNMADVSVGYDALDRVTAMTDGLGTSAYAYDTLNRVTSIDGPWANDTVNYSYDNLGRQSALGLNGTTLSSYGYDPLDRLNSLSSGAGTWNYAYVGTTGKLSQITNPNGTKSAYGYDAMQRLTSVANTTSTNANLSTFAYGFDAPNTPQRDVRTSVDKTYGNNPTQRVSYTYDTVDQLTNEVLSENNTPLFSKSFAYDAMGNRSAAGTVSASDTVSGSYSANKLNQITAVSASWGGGRILRLRLSRMTRAGT